MMVSSIKSIMQLPFQTLFSLICVALIILRSEAKCQPHQTLRLEANEHISKVAWRDSIYRFPDFLRGRVAYLDGFSPNYYFKFNYNIYYEQLFFINHENDTLMVKDMPVLKQVTIGHHVFYHDSNYGYLEIIHEGDVSLAKKNIMILDAIERGGARFGQHIDYRGTIKGYARLYRKATTYYLIDTKSREYKTYKVSLHTFFKLFPDLRIEIKEFVKQNNVDFKEQQSIFSVLQFCERVTTP